VLKIDYVKEYLQGLVLLHYRRVRRVLDVNQRKHSRLGRPLVVSFGRHLVDLRSFRCHSRTLVAAFVVRAQIRLNQGLQFSGGYSRKGLYGFTLSSEHIKYKIKI